MGPYTETTESAAAPVLVLSAESALVPATIRGLDPSPDGVTALSRVQPGEPVAGNLLDGFCEGGWAQEVHFETCPYPPHDCAIGPGRHDRGACKGRQRAPLDRKMDQGRSH